MKLVRNITVFVATMMLAMSCTTDVDQLQLNNPDGFTAPIIGKCSNVIVNADNSKVENVIFTWKTADFGLPIEILYSVYLVSGEKSTLLGTSSSTSFSISKGDLNGAAINGLGILANTTGVVTAYVTAKASGTDEYVPIRSNISNEFSVTTYAAPLTKLYAVGLFNGWKEGSAVEIWETNGGTNTFEGLINFIDEVDADKQTGFSGFKILTERSWNGGNWGYDAFKVSADITKSTDGNLVLPVGYWKISVNKVAMTIDAKAVSFVDVLGTINGWNEAGGNTPLTYDAVDNVWVSKPLTFDADGEFLVRLNASWDYKYGSSGIASTAISGGLELVAAGGSNIKVPAAGTYVIKLHAERTPYVVEMIKQ